MRIKVLPGDFAVKEVLAVPLAEGGHYVVYRARKRAITTLQLQNRLAAALGLSNSAVAFPALKDRQAIAVQFCTVRGAVPPQVKGRGFTAERIGWLDRQLSPGDLAGNRFSVVLRDLSQDEAARVTAQLAEMARWGLPNYFDVQRFGSRLADGEFPGRLILRRDEAGALRAHLAGQQIGDASEVHAFKAFAAASRSVTLRRCTLSRLSPPRSGAIGRRFLHARQSRPITAVCSPTCAITRTAIARR
jgi:tRNA pseudouridine13 synthase